MAKRKAVRGAGRKHAVGGRRSARPTAKKTAPSRKTGRSAASKSARKATATAGASRKAAIGRSKAAARPQAAAKKKTSPARKRALVKTKAKTKAAVPVRRAAGKPMARRTPSRKVRPPVRTAPGLNRERRTIPDAERVPSPPSSLDLDRSASAARSGRRELLEKYAEHTETSPAMTGGDVDANWESAYSVGDEAPGGDSPTPDQDIVDDIGRAVGVEYQDNEELKGERKITERDRHRWELDPASSDDWEDR